VIFPMGSASGYVGTGHGVRPRFIHPFGIGGFGRDDGFGCVFSFFSSFR
jgi:hypothetical protein